MHWLQHGVIPTQIQLYFANFWAQVHDLPIGYMTVTVEKFCDQLFQKALVRRLMDGSGKRWLRYSTNEEERLGKRLRKNDHHPMNYMHNKDSKKGSSYIIKGDSEGDIK